MILIAQERSWQHKRCAVLNDAAAVRHYITRVSVVVGAEHRARDIHVILEYALILASDITDVDCCNVSVQGIVIQVRRCTVVSSLAHLIT